MSLRLELQLDRERFAPAETVKGSVLVVEGGGSRSLGVSLTYNEKTEDFFSRVGAFRRVVLVAVCTRHARRYDATVIGSTETIFVSFYT